MNRAEEIRNAEITRMRDTDLLERLVNTYRDDIETGEFKAFFDMLGALVSGEQRCLSVKQRVWAETVARRVWPLDASLVPRGREVATPTVLQNLPKAPPGRKESKP